MKNYKKNKTLFIIDTNIYIYKSYYVINKKKL